MKLLIESSAQITEATTDQNKNLFLQGIFMQAEAVNRNGRLYPADIMRGAVEKYKENYISKNRAFGELAHPESPKVIAENISHIITSLEMDGNNVIGKAKILNTPKGNIARGLIEGGGVLGMSSRAMGSVDLRDGVEYIQEDFQLETVDIVLDPSAHDAFVESLVENAEWIWNNGSWSRKTLTASKNRIKKASKRDLDKSIFEEFTNLIESLK